MKNLRKRYSKFIYEDYAWKLRRGNLDIFFNFKILPDISFKHKITVKNVKRSQIKRVGERILKNLVFHIGLVEILNYWKTTHSSVIEIKAGYLNKEQIKFWNNLITKGMSQFFYENGLAWPSLKIVAYGNNYTPANLLLNFKLGQNFLVPVGGGKDSVVTLENLRKKKAKIKCFLVNPTKAAQNIVRIAKIREKVFVERKIDKKLLQLNKKGAFNGHIPITAVLSFLSVLAATLFNCKNIAFSNEKSADEGNLKYLGETINHQWSKSSEFEKKFKKYCNKYLLKEMNYFSFLRKCNEATISKIFVRHKKYFLAFKSCNQGRKTNSWCKNCAKCLFVYASLYPYLEKRDMLKIFGNDIFENKKLLTTMRELIGKGDKKPFECVGTFSESRKIFKLCLKKAERFGKIPYLLAQFKKT